MFGKKGRKLASVKQLIAGRKLKRQLNKGRSKGKHTKQFIKMISRYLAISAAMLLLYIVLLFVLVQVEKGAEGATIKTMGSAVWYSLVTFTTVGYGDLSPVTPAGRIIASVFLLIGIGLLGFFIGFMVEFFTRMKPAFLLALSTDKPWYIFTDRSSYAMMFAENLKEVRPNALIIYALSEDDKKVTKDICVPWSVEEILERRGYHFDAHIMCMKENEMENFLDAVGLAATEVSIICLASFTPAHHPININFFSLTDFTARVFWQQFPVRTNAESIVIIGFGAAGREMLDRALELNVISDDQHICYHVFGDGSEYCRNRKRLSEIVSINQISVTSDSIIFHDKPWNHDEALIRNADRIILCADVEWENLEILHIIQKFFAIRGQLYIYNSNVRGVATSFGKARDLLTPAFVLHNRLSDMALCRHEMFRYFSGKNVTLWEDLNSLTKDLNYITIDHISIKVRILLGDEAPDCPFDEVPVDILKKAFQVFCETDGEERERLRRIEHIRNLRFYRLHNYTYGELINDEERINPFIVPYEKLDEKGKQIIDISWNLIDELATQQQARRSSKRA